MTNNLKKEGINKEIQINNLKKMDKKILDKNLRIVKNNNIALTNDNNELDFKNIQIIEDKIEFDKSKYKKPEIYYPLQHDKFLIPPLENLNKKNKEIKYNFDMNDIKERYIEKTLYNNKNKKNDKFKTYASKLDDFMTSTNYNFNENNNKRTLAPFYETGIPKNLMKNSENKKSAEETN